MTVPGIKSEDIDIEPSLTGTPGGRKEQAKKNQESRGDKINLPLSQEELGGALTGVSWQVDLGRSSLCQVLMRGSFMGGCVAAKGERCKRAKPKEKRRRRGLNASLRISSGLIK